MTNHIQTADEAILAALARIEAKVDAALGRGAERLIPATCGWSWTGDLSGIEWECTLEHGHNGEHYGPFPRSRQPAAPTSGAGEAATSDPYESSEHAAWMRLGRTPTQPAAPTSGAGEASSNLCELRNDSDCDGSDDDAIGRCIMHRSPTMRCLRMRHDDDTACIYETPETQRDRAVAVELDDCGRVTHEEARTMVDAFIKSHFRGGDRNVRVSFPANPQCDYDIRLSAYVSQQVVRENDYHRHAAIWKALAKRYRAERKTFEAMWRGLLWRCEQYSKEVGDLKRAAPPQDVTAAVESPAALLLRRIQKYAREDRLVTPRFTRLRRAIEEIDTLLPATYPPAQPATVGEGLDPLDLAIETNGLSVRITHVPTGIVAHSNIGPSQHASKVDALRILRKNLPPAAPEAAPASDAPKRHHSACICVTCEDSRATPPAEPPRCKAWCGSNWESHATVDHHIDPHWPDVWWCYCTLDCRNAGRALRPSGDAGGGT